MTPERLALYGLYRAFMKQADDVLVVPDARRAYRRAAAEVHVALNALPSKSPTRKDRR